MATMTKNFRASLGKALTVAIKGLAEEDPTSPVWLDDLSHGATEKLWTNFISEGDKGLVRIMDALKEVLNEKTANEVAKKAKLDTNLSSEPDLPFTKKLYEGVIAGLQKGLTKAPDPEIRNDMTKLFLGQILMYLRASTNKDVEPEDRLDSLAQIPVRKNITKFLENLRKEGAKARSKKCDCASCEELIRISESDYLSRLHEATLLVVQPLEELERAETLKV